MKSLQKKTPSKTVNTTGPSSRLPLRLVKYGMPSLKRSVKVLQTMIAISCILLLQNESAFAGTVAGTGGSTEITQILNNIQLVSAYQKQIEQFVTQGQQYAAQLKNMQNNPASAQPVDTQNMINNISRMMGAGQSMGGSLAQIDGSFAARYNNTSAASYSQNFSTWTTSSKDTLQGAMRTAGLRRDQYPTDAAALSALYDESQSSSGTVGAIQTLSKINMKQIEQMQGLSELMASQNIASSTYMASTASQAQAAVDQDAKIQASFRAGKPTAVVPLDTNTRTYQKLNLYSK